MRAEVRSGRSDFTPSRPMKADRVEAAGGGHSLDAGAAPGRGGGVEAGGAHGQHLLGVRRLHRGHRVAGVDGAHEGIGIDDAGDFADLLDVEQGGNPRHQVLAERGGRGGEVRIGPGHADDEVGHGLNRRIGVAGRDQHGLDAGDGGRRGGGLVRAAGHQQQVDRTQRAHRGDGAARRRGDGFAVMVGNDEDGHVQITFASPRSFSTSSLTEPTFTPALRVAGSSTLMTVRRGVGSTPRSAGVTFSIIFLRAFMMLGSEA